MIGHLKKKIPELHKVKSVVFLVLPHLLQITYTLPLTATVPYYRNWKASFPQFPAATASHAMGKCRKTLDF